tara:strand:+ start:441 stop:1010 length:570 start_codon:yes stop_codon:yes gene_type:complete
MKIDIQKYCSDHFRQVKTMASSHLMRDIRCGDLLKPGIFCFVALQQEKVVGFSIGKVIQLDKLLALYPGLKGKFFLNLTHQYIGMLQSVAVLEEYRGLGIGSKLTKPRVDLFNSLHLDIITIAWKGPGGTMAAPVVKKFGLKKVAEIENCWSHFPKPENFDVCMGCNNFPCECSAEVYFRKYHEDTDMR